VAAAVLPGERPAVSLDRRESARPTLALLIHPVVTTELPAYATAMAGVRTAYREPI
jgi:hypothetical protein